MTGQVGRAIGAIFVRRVCVLGGQVSEGPAVGGQVDSSSLFAAQAQ
jgi:hypothetical protein